MTVPTMVAHTRAEFVAWCRGIDAGPFSSLAVPERVTYPSADLLVELAAAAVLTERVRLVSTILVLPTYDEVRAAKQVATVDVLSDGRLTVGVGVGARRHDCRAVGAPFERRWQRLDDQVARMRTIWAGEPPFEGADPVGPPPVQPGGPPLTAGALGPKAIARAARWASGIDSAWTVTGQTAGLTDAVSAVRAAWRDAGRADEPRFTTSLWFALGEGAAERLRAYVHAYTRIFGSAAAESMAAAATCSSAEALRDTAAAIAFCGVDELFLVPTTADPAELRRAVTALA